jgi:hypothetical protein
VGGKGVIVLWGSMGGGWVGLGDAFGAWGGVCVGGGVGWWGGIKEANRLISHA